MRGASTTSSIFWSSSLFNASGEMLLLGTAARAIERRGYLETVPSFQTVEETEKVHAGRARSKPGAEVLLGDILYYLHFNISTL